MLSQSSAKGRHGDSSTHQRISMYGVSKCAKAPTSSVPKLSHTPIFISNMDKGEDLFCIILHNTFAPFATLAPYALVKIEKVVAFVAIVKNRDLCGHFTFHLRNLLEYHYKA